MTIPDKSKLPEAFEAFRLLQPHPGSTECCNTNHSYFQPCPRVDAWNAYLTIRDGVAPPAQSVRHQRYKSELVRNLEVRNGQR